VRLVGGDRGLSSSIVVLVVWLYEMCGCVFVEFLGFVWLLGLSWFI